MGENRLRSLFTAMFPSKARRVVNRIIADYANTDQPVTPEEEEMLMRQASIGIICFRNTVDATTPSGGET